MRAIRSSTAWSTTEQGFLDAQIDLPSRHHPVRLLHAELRRHVGAGAGARALPEIPFIFVSGTLGEEYAIGALKSGAVDYVLKGNLLRRPALRSSARWKRRAAAPSGAAPRPS